MKKPLILLFALLLTGCITDPSTGEDLSQSMMQHSSSGGGPLVNSTCTIYGMDQSTMVPTDSGTTCPYSDHGSYAPLITKVQWSGSCNVRSWRDVDGGVYGLKYPYGCYRKAPENPVKLVPDP